MEWSTLQLCFIAPQQFPQTLIRNPGWMLTSWGRIGRQRDYESISEDQVTSDILQPRFHPGHLNHFFCAQRSVQAVRDHLSNISASLYHSSFYDMDLEEGPLYIGAVVLNRSMFRARMKSEEKLRNYFKIWFSHWLHKRTGMSDPSPLAFHTGITRWLQEAKIPLRNKQLLLVRITIFALIYF